MSSSRVQISFTGAPTAFDAATAAGTKSTSRRRPKPPPSRVVWTLTWLRLQSRRLGRNGLRQLLHLRADIHVAAIRLDVGRAIHGLHRRVRQKRQLIHGGKGLGSSLERFGCVTALECGCHIIARERRAPGLAAASLSRDQIAALSRSALGPGSQTMCKASRAFLACQKCSATTITALAVGNTRRTPGMASAAAESTEADLAAEFWAECDGGVQHARQLHVQAKFSAAIYLARRIEPRQGLADQAKIDWVLERHLLGDRQFRGCLGQLAVARAFLP